MPSTTDVWSNLEARALVADLTDRGLTLRVVQGRLQVAPQSLLTVEDDRAIRAHRDAMIIIVLVGSDAVLDRLLRMRAGDLGTAQDVPSHTCYVCAGPLPTDRPTGRCGPCALASRLYAGAPIMADIITLFPPEVRGLQVVPVTLAGGLPFDARVPA